MRISTIFCLLLISFLCSAQVQTNHFILSCEQNKDWVQKLKSADLDNQLASIKNRILTDTSVFFIATRNPHGPDKIEEGYNKTTHCRPLYIFTSNDNKVFLLSPNPDKKAVKEIAKYLAQAHVSKISTTDIKAAAIYGSRASHGVIFVEFKDEEVFKLLNNLN